MTRHARGALWFGSALLLTVLLALPAEAQRVIHRVRFGESLASVSTHYYGKAIYSEIIGLANGLVSGTAKLTPGQRIRVPTAWFYTPRKSTSLSAVAATYLGDARRWPALAMLNKLRGRRRRVRAGTRLLIPFTLPYTVAEGQSFSDISQRFYGTKKYAGLVASFNFISDTSPSAGTQIEIPNGTPRILPAVLDELTNQRVLGLSERVNRGLRQGLQEANALLRRGDYWAVPLRLLRLLGTTQASDADVAEVFKLLAVAYVALGKHDLAVESFRAALLRRPQLKLDIVTTSPKVMRAYVDAKAGIKDAPGQR